ncbi:MAG TPA: adenosine kinase [Acidimicrobiales bacterium]|nr:adenosine kinase [Acidimicrobiales bacterium]
MNSAPEVVAVGHAIVDVLAPSPDSLVASLGLEKGTMTLIDDGDAERIYADLGPATEASGGSAANTAACLASLGASVEFTGKVRDDGLGRVFTHDIRAAGVRFQVEPATAGPGTGRCLVMVTPDAEKTMCTNLGAGALLSAADIDADAIASARVLYLEGYLCGKPETDPAVERAISVARDRGTLVALSGSDPAWVELKRAALDALLDRVDIFFGNEAEACGLTGTDSADAALVALSHRCQTVAITLGAHGSIVAQGSEVVSVPAAPVTQVVDTTGAGDSYAAGFLYGVVRDSGPERSARLGAIAAAEIVSHLGARPLARLSDLAATAGVTA